jgi:hypothetical protein
MEFRRLRVDLCCFTHLSDDTAVAKMGHPGFDGGEGDLCRFTHLSDDDAVAKMGHPGFAGGFGGFGGEGPLDCGSGEDGFGDGEIAGGAVEFGSFERFFGDAVHLLNFGQSVAGGYSFYVFCSIRR